MALFLGYVKLRLAYTVSSSSSYPPWNPNFL